PIGCSALRSRKKDLMLPLPALLLSVLLGSPIQSPSAPAPQAVVGGFEDGAAAFASTSNGASILAAWRDGDVMHVARLFPWLTADPSSVQTFALQPGHSASINPLVTTDDAQFLV